ncbi:MAG TPA: hypothetical protein DFR83_19250 [Deltaproteobacteria bacterium]|nr:hypothetical protein [Deltaproteobacteria bacterium]
MTQTSRLVLACMMCGCASPPGWVDDRFFIRVDDADLHVHAVGEATSNKFVLMLHDDPAGGSGRYELAPSAATLHEEMVMIYLDQRGAGASQTRTAPADITLELLREDLLTVIEVIERMYLEPNTGHPELWLMGHGWGGMVGPSVLFETDAAERLAGWIEVAGAHDLPKVHLDSAAQLLEAAQTRLEEDLDEDSRSGWTSIRKAAEAASPTADSLQAFLDLQQVAWSAIRLSDEVAFSTVSNAEALGWYLQHPDPDGTRSAIVEAVTAALLRAELQTSWSERYRELALPTLLLNGRHNYVVPSTLNDDVELRIASDHIESVLFEQSAHHPMFEEPTAFADTLLDFMGEPR